ncbi:MULTISPECIES: hypothetical protein [Pirellulaceae]|uniref:Chromosome segregation ATPase n=1 Tax=Aporhodopirellula rubra TaxID=980271 RepID=A0A7W5H953_9BACT|nr:MULTISPECIES: hypothetical protein [Pirellulaceae]EMI40409.1 hypothetical protein RRSWK_07121 [Rhodopirellula sp. SWK7]MBB3210054.1 chromosome segregation ATPase [Aporhodopirellula rubra]
MTARTIEQLKSEYEQLNERKIQAQTQLQEAQKQLTALQAEAEKEFGTSDVKELTEKLEQMETENEKRRSEYQTLLDKISGDLAEVEKATAANTTADA